MTSAVTRWNSIRNIIARISHPGGITQLVAVSKAQPVEAILPLLTAGQRLFGENKVQEVKAKWPALILTYPDVALHLIGPLQTNKVKDAVALFDVIETIDRISIVDALIQALGKNPAARAKTFFIQVNIGGEPQKSGVSVAEFPGLLKYCRAQSVAISGLMGVPPADKPPAPYFEALQILAKEYQLPYLSMGMSGDYESAIHAGATHVRIGTALFGERLNIIIKEL